MIHQVHFDPLFFCGALLCNAVLEKKCLIFKQITGFDVVTDLFFENFNLNEKKSCNSCRVDSN
jgi:hypothetical protein